MSAKTTTHEPRKELRFAVYVRHEGGGGYLSDMLWHSVEEFNRSHVYILPDWTYTLIPVKIEIPAFLTAEGDGE